MNNYQNVFKKINKKQQLINLKTMSFYFINAIQLMIHSYLTTPSNGDTDTRRQCTPAWLSIEVWTILQKIKFYQFIIIFSCLTNIEISAQTVKKNL